MKRKPAKLTLSRKKKIAFLIKKNDSRSVIAIAAEIGISREAFYEYLKKFPDLRASFAERRKRMIEQEFSTVE